VGGLTCGAVKVLCQQALLDVWDSHSRLHPTGLSARQRAVFGHGRTNAAMQLLPRKDARPVQHTALDSADQHLMTLVNPPRHHIMAKGDRDTAQLPVDSGPAGGLFLIL
jgi:hypothetical protein